MYWFSRPSYGRWVLAVLIVLVAAYMDLTGPATEAYPFAAEDTSQGEALVVEWREVPAGLLPAPGDSTGRAAASLAAGTPLVTGLVDSGPPAPAGWWAVPVELPATTSIGTQALLSLPDQTVLGVVVDVGLADSFGGGSQGLVAVAPEHAAAVAAAVSSGNVIVLIRP